MLHESGKTLEGVYESVSQDPRDMVKAVLPEF
jgi:hypothetical protein